MGIIELVRKIWKWFHRGRGISILVPMHFSNHHDQRAKNWKWLKEYWECHLPGAEIIVGEDRHCNDIIPFSKCAAVNNAASKATGDVYVIVDADIYYPAHAVLEAAKKIRKARRIGHKLWFVPYNSFLRLTRECSEIVLNSWPCDPYVFDSPPPCRCIKDITGSHHGHWYGAGIQILPREAFECVGGWDIRFRGWGGEDHSAMRACDTLYWPHKTLPHQVLHLWHPMNSPTKTTDEVVSWKERTWENQKASGTNDNLTNRYNSAYGDVVRMRKLVNESKENMWP